VASTDDLIPLPQFCEAVLARFKMPEDDLLAARAQLKLTYRSVWHATVSGRLPTVQIRRARFVTRADADRYARGLGMVPRGADAPAASAASIAA
jgi:hypothetical protein